MTHETKITEESILPIPDEEVTQRYQYYQTHLPHVLGRVASLKAETDQLKEELERFKAELDQQGEKKKNSKQQKEKLEKDTQRLGSRLEDYAYWQRELPNAECLSNLTIDDVRVVLENEQRARAQAIRQWNERRQALQEEQYTAATQLLRANPKMTVKLAFEIDYGFGPKAVSPTATIEQLDFTSILGVDAASDVFVQAIPGNFSSGSVGSDIRDWRGNATTLLKRLGGNGASITWGDNNAITKVTGKSRPVLGPNCKLKAGGLAKS